MWGLLWMAIILPAVNFIPCNYEKICNNGTVEDISFLFDQISQKKIMILYLVLFYLSLIAFNYSNFTIIKYLSAMAEEINGVLRVISVWIISIIITVTTDYDWEDTDWKIILI